MSKEFGSLLKEVEKVDMEANAKGLPEPVRVVKVMMTFEFKDSRMLPLEDLIDYIGYRLNLSDGSAHLVKLANVCVLEDTGIKEACIREV